jgi:hypothetical protein
MTQPRWFSEQELHEMARPTMDRALEHLAQGSYDEVAALCEAMKHEWRFLHDAMAEQILGLISFVARRLGEDAVAEAWECLLEPLWHERAGKILDQDRRETVMALAATWRAHSTSGVGPEAGAFTITEDEEKFTFTMNPCGSGQRLVRLGKYEKNTAYGVTQEAHDWSYGRADFPLYCTHCTFMNESLPIKWYGIPLYPSVPPLDYAHDPCIWYWYKNPDDIPEQYWQRYGRRKPPAVAKCTSDTGEVTDPS